MLIADDVGLGKTIEAGLALLELMARGRVERVLVVVPPGLMEQWRQELLDKFGLEFRIVGNASDLAEAQKTLPAGVSPWDALPWVITSIDYLKKDTVRSRAPRRFAVAEHSARLSGEERARRETDFKEGKLDALVCTPTLELGVDIGPLPTVVMRNAPPTPANYAQRVGRAGRRLRIGYVSTFCAGCPHDRHAFERPEWFVAGRFDPPKLRLDNPKVVLRHLRSHVLAQLEKELPYLLKDLLDDVHRPTRWKREDLEALFEEIRERRDSLVQAILRVTEYERKAGLVTRYGEEDVKALVDGFEEELTKVLDRWWQRVEQLDREFQEYSAIGYPRQDEKKAAAQAGLLRRNHSGLGAGLHPELPGDSASPSGLSVSSRHLQPRSWRRLLLATSFTRTSINCAPSECFIPGVLAGSTRPELMPRPPGGLRPFTFVPSATRP